MADHETPYQRLADRLEDQLGRLVATGPNAQPGKRAMLRPFAEVDAFPAIFVYDTIQTPTIDPEHLPARWVYGATVVIYARASGDMESSGPALNALVAAVESALMRQPTDPITGMGALSFMPGQVGQTWTTLGGSVLYARPGGPVVIEPGEQGVAYFPVEMRPVPSET